MSKPSMPRLLLIEDCQADAAYIQAMAAGCVLINTVRLSSGLELLREQPREQPFDLVLLDLGLPDSTGLETFHRLREKEPQIPVIVLTGLADENLAGQAIASGAQDYLVKGQISGEILTRSIRYAIERKRVEENLRASERHFRELADAMPQLVWTAWPDGKVDYYNQRYHEFVGIGPEAEGCMWVPLLHADDVAPTLAAWQKAIATGTLYEIEHRVKRMDGGFHWYLSRGVPVRDAAGAVTRWYGTATDIQARKRAEEELQKAHAKLEKRVRERTAQLERINRELEDFIYVATHDLQEPLRKIQMFAEKLIHTLPEGLNGRACSYLEKIRQAAGRMQALVLDLLQYSRFPLQPRALSRFNLRVAVDEALAEVRGLCEINECRIEIDPLPEIEAAKDHMRQLFKHLIENGVKNRGADTSVIRIQDATPGPGGFVTIHVEDNGLGFDPAYLDKIFRPFQRLYGEDAPYPGTGMGLALCRAIVERHGGTITARSQPGHGATFIVRLPKCQTQKEGEM